MSLFQSEAHYTHHTCYSPGVDLEGILEFAHFCNDQKTCLVDDAMAKSSCACAYSARQFQFVIHDIMGYILELPNPIKVLFPPDFKIFQHPCGLTACSGVLIEKQTNTMQKSRGHYFPMWSNKILQLRKSCFCS